MVVITNPKEGSTSTMYLRLSPRMIFNAGSAHSLAKNRKIYRSFLCLETMPMQTNSHSALPIVTPACEDS